MPDVTVDSILLEIEAPADKAKAGLDKIKNSLNAMKTATTGIDVSKLNQFRDFVNSITVSKDTGDSIKNMGAGLRSLTKSVNSLSQIDSAKLNEVADVISKIGASLGQLGTNVGAFFADDRASRADHDEEACFELRLERIVRRANDALCTISDDSAANLFRYRKTETVDEVLLGIFPTKARRGKILQDVNGDRFSYEAFPVFISLLV